MPRLLLAILLIAGPCAAGAWFGGLFTRRHGVAGMLGALALLAIATGIYTAVFVATVDMGEGLAALGLHYGWLFHGVAAVATLIGAAVGGIMRARSEDGA